MKSLDGHRQYNIQRLWDRTREVRRMILLGMGNKEISAAMAAQGVKLGPQQISNIRNSSIVRRELEILHGAKDADAVRLRDEVTQIAHKGALILDQMLENEETPEALKAKIATDMIKQALPQRTESIVGQVQLTKEDIEEIKQRAFQSGSMIRSDQSTENEGTEDAEFVEINDLDQHSDLD